MDQPSPTQPADEAPRRRSGRVTRAPEKLSPSAAGKRKRSSAVADAQGDATRPGQDDSDDVDSDDDDADDSSEADEEELRDRARRKRQTANKTRKAPAKRVRLNGDASTTLAIRSTPKKARLRAKKARPSAVEAGGLYADIFGTHEVADTIAGQWLTRFQTHESMAVREIVNLVLRAAGCEQLVTVDDIEDPDNCTNKLSDLQDDFQAQNIVDYPLIERGRGAATNFRADLARFFIALIKTVEADRVLLTKPELIENIQVWVGAMTSSANRPFRHTATVVSLDIITALAQLLRDNVEARARMLRQVEGEQRKARGGNKERIKSIQKEADAGVEVKTALENLLRDWFDVIFVHRYRDVDPKIRVDCLTALAEWMMIYPDHFLVGEHLRYLGWCLSDSAASARLCVLKGLVSICKDDSKLSGLRQFTDRFRARMVEMATSDADLSVRTCAIELLDVLRDKGLLEPDDIDTVGKLIYDSEPKVRKAVVGFFVASVDESFDMKVEELGGQEALDEALPDDNEDNLEAPRIDWLRFKALAELMLAYDGDQSDAAVTKQTPTQPGDQMVAAGLDSRYTIAAQAVLGQIPALDEWETLAGMLLFDHSSTAQGTDVASQLRQESKLVEQEEVILLDVLNTLVKQQLTDSVEENAPAKKAKKTKVQIRELQETRDLAGQRLADFVPKLLRKFGATPDAAAAVLRLERLLNLDVFQELRQDSTAFSSLLDGIKKQFVEHENEVVIAEASAALAHAKSYDELEEITTGKLTALWDDTGHSLAALCLGEEVGVRGSMNASMAGGVCNTLLRIANLASVSNCIEGLETSQSPKAKKVRRGGGPLSKARSQQQQPVSPIALLLELLLRGVPVANVATDINAIEDSLVCNAVRSLFFYFLWQSRALAESETLPSPDALSAVADKCEIARKHLRRVMRKRKGADDVSLAAAGLLLDLHTAYIQLAPADDEVDAEDASSSSLWARMDDETQADVLRVFNAAERDFARKTRRQVPEPEDEDVSEDEDADPEDSEVEVEEDDEEEDSAANGASADIVRRKQQSLLVAEQRFCTFAGKIVLALAAGCTDEPLFASGQRKSSNLRKRLLRNKTKLGSNFKELCEKLDLDNDKSKKGARKGATTANTNQAGALSKEMVDDEDDEDDADNDQPDEAVEEERQTVEEQAAEREQSEQADGAGADAAAEDAESVIGD